MSRLLPPLRDTQEREGICPLCPVCKSEAEKFYRDLSGDICGCEYCVTTVSTWEVDEWVEN